MYKECDSTITGGNIFCCLYQYIQSTDLWSTPPLSEQPLEAGQVPSSRCVVRWSRSVVRNGVSRQARLFHQEAHAGQLPGSGCVVDGRGAQRILNAAVQHLCSKLHFESLHVPLPRSEQRPVALRHHDGAAAAPLTDPD